MNNEIGKLFLDFANTDLKTNMTMYNPTLCFIQFIVMLHRHLIAT